MLHSDVIGNLGADAEIKESNGKKYVFFTLAHNEVKNSIVNPDEKERTTIWVRVFWYGTGGAVFDRLKQGTKVFVRGRVQVGIYTDRSGAPQLSYSLYANEVIPFNENIQSDKSEE